MASTQSRTPRGSLRLRTTDPPTLTGRTHRGSHEQENRRHQRACIAARRCRRRRRGRPEHLRGSTPRASLPRAGTRWTCSPGATASICRTGFIARGVRIIHVPARAAALRAQGRAAAVHERLRGLRHRHRRPSAHGGLRTTSCTRISSCPAWVALQVEACTRHALRHDLPCARQGAPAASGRTTSSRASGSKSSSAVIEDADAIIAECPQDEQDLVELYDADRARIAVDSLRFRPWRAAGRSIVLRPRSARRRRERSICCCSLAAWCRARASIRSMRAARRLLRSAYSVDARLVDRRRRVRRARPDARRRRSGA